MYRSEAYKRALERVYKDGIVAVYDANKDAYFTNSASDPSSIHKILVRGTQYICDCTGFWRTGCCKHVAAVFETQKVLKHIWICPNCRTVIPCKPTMDIATYELHMEGKCSQV